MIAIDLPGELCHGDRKSGRAGVCDMEVGTERLALYQGTGFSRAKGSRERFGLQME